MKPNVTFILADGLGWAEPGRYLRPPQRDA